MLNLRWDVLAWSAAADRLLGFSSFPAEHRNLLWLLFTAPSMRALFDPWQDQALQILSSFRRDFVRAPLDPDIGTLVKALEKIDTDLGPGGASRISTALVRGSVSERSRGWPGRLRPYVPDDQRRP